MGQQQQMTRQKIRVSGLHIVGTSFSDDILVKSAAVAAMAGEQSFTIVGERDNEFDRNAISFRHCGQRVGYLSKNDASTLRKFVSRHGFRHCEVANVKVFGGTTDKQYGFWIDLDFS